jgi:putative transcriptional regulator
MPRQKQSRTRNVLRAKGESTEFQILLEVMRSQPHVKQKEIADAVGITVQAVSKHFKKLAREGLLDVGLERANYRLTPEANDKLSEYLKSLNAYTARIKSDLKVERLLPVLATQRIKEGESMGIIMKEGVLYAVAPDHPDAEAHGIAAQDAELAEDVGLRDLQGKVKTRQGKVVMVRLPSIREGGSRAVDLAKVRRFYGEFHPDRVGVVGVVGRAVLNKLGLQADLDFGITRATALAAERGLNVFVVVVGRMVNRVIEEIDTTNIKHGSNISYEVKDGTIAQKTF